MRFRGDYWKLTSTVIVGTEIASDIVSLTRHALFLTPTQRRSRIPVDI